MKNQVFQIRGIVIVILCLNLCCEPNYEVPPSDLAQAFAADLTIKDLKSVIDKVSKELRYKKTEANEYIIDYIINNL